MKVTKVETLSASIHQWVKVTTDEGLTASATCTAGVAAAARRSLCGPRSSTVLST